jgi:hypothetical protein
MAPQLDVLLFADFLNRRVHFPLSIPQPANFDLTVALKMSFPRKVRQRIFDLVLLIVALDILQNELVVEISLKLLGRNPLIGVGTKKSDIAVEQGVDGGFQVGRSGVGGCEDGLMMRGADLEGVLHNKMKV